MVRRDMGVLKQLMIIRSYESRVDRERVEDLERRCEVGPAERVFLLTDNLGDPICRIRNSPMYKMLVAESSENELVGVIQGTIKVVTINDPNKSKARVGYVLGLRVSPNHRRKGIASNLVKELEKWFISNEAEYSYMATLKDNEPSLKLFVDSLGYKKFRTPAILVNPVQTRPARIESHIEILKLGVTEAEAIYREYMGQSTEFFPQDIDKVLRNKLSLGTYVAYFRGKDFGSSFDSNSPPESWAMVSVWNTGEVFKLWLAKAPLSCLLYTKSSRVLSKLFPWFDKLLPDFFDPFGFYFMYGLHCRGSNSGRLVRALCRHVHNMAVASEGDCKVVVTEVGADDVAKPHVPHWKLLSCPEDLWCIKALRNININNSNIVSECWTKTQPQKALFVDPREV